MELFKDLKLYSKGGNPKLVEDWKDVPRKTRIKIVKETLPSEFIDKLEKLKLTDEIFNGHSHLPNEKTYKERLLHYLNLFPTFEEFTFESCHWNNVIYDVRYSEEFDTKDIYTNNFEYLYYAIFNEKFPLKSFTNWSNDSENENKFLSDFVREIKFNKNKYVRKI